MEYTVDNIISEALELAKIENYEREVNTRTFEMKITAIAREVVVNKALYDSLKENIKKYYKTNKKAAFNLFFILFTICRRQNYGDIVNLAIDAEDDFEEYEIVKHIKLMAILDKSSHTATLYKAIKESSKLVELKNDDCDFTTHTGVLNVYTALICKYFEYQLDERNEPDNKALMLKALKCIRTVIEIEKQEKGSYEAVYEKFYLNHGRILILLEKYTKGEEEILKAISLLPESADRNAKVNEYNQYLLKASIIHSYDLNEEKVKDLDKIKVSNYKSIALMTTLLGFLLGTINIFTTITDRFTLAILMLGYAGILLLLVGTILLGFSLTLKERKKVLYVYDILLIIIGIAIFAITMLIINKG